MTVSTPSHIATTAGTLLRLANVSSPVHGSTSRGPVLRAQEAP